jgi:outer membrane biosynthesis protein TonB
MPKEELLAALCQALGIETGESPEETVQDKEPAAQEDAATDPPEESKKEEPAAVQEDAATEPPEESAKEKPAATQEDAVTEPPEESKKEEPAATQEDAATEPAPEAAKEEEPPTKKSAKKKKAPAQESTPAESPAVVSKEKGELKLQIRELKSQRDAALETHDHVLLKSIRRRIRTLKRKVRRIAA